LEKILLRVMNSTLFSQRRYLGETPKKEPLTEVLLLIAGERAK